MSDLQAAVAEARSLSPSPSNRLRAAFEADRAAVDAKHPPITDPNKCRYCGKQWFRFSGTQFEGHVICAVSQDFQDAVVVVLDAGVSYAAVSRQIGVSPNVVRAWWHSTKRQK